MRPWEALGRRSRGDGGGGVAMVVLSWDQQVFWSTVRGWVKLWRLNVQLKGAMFGL